MKFLKLISAILLLLLLQCCYKEEIIYNTEADSNLELPSLLRINGKECCYDHIEKNLRYPINADSINNFSPLIEFQNQSTVYFNDNTLQNGSINHLGKIENNKAYQVRIETQNGVQHLSLTFTCLPIVQIITPNTIRDEPKTLARIVVNYTEEDKVSDSFLTGIEYRGQTSQSYQKKSYGFSLKGSMNLNNEVSNSFFDMKKNNDWILDAMWTDKARLRNKTSFELWNKMDVNHRGIDAEFVELFINNEHQGLYCLGEKINAEFLNVSNPNAVIYKAVDWAGGATQFENCNTYPPINDYWDGWEQKYPDPGIMINWNPLNELRKLVINGGDEKFTSQIESLIKANNFIDYYIFLNVISAIDNTGKNTFLVKENMQNEFSIIPWDLDGTWGLLWDGTYAGYSSVLSNNLFDRLFKTNPHDFRVKVKHRWHFLRDDIFSNTNLKRLFLKNFTQINRSGIIVIENKKWDANIDIEKEKEYLTDWMDQRLIFLDNYFKNL